MMACLFGTSIDKMVDSWPQPVVSGPLATAIPMFRNDLPMASDPEHFPYGPPETSIRPPAARS